MIADTHNIAFMDLLIVNHCIADCIGYLSGFNPTHLLCHGLQIFLFGMIRNKINHSCNSLGNRFGRNNYNFLVLYQILSLFCCQNNVFIIWQNVNRICIHMINGIEHILCAGIHGLTAFDQIVYTDSAENLAKPLSD